MNNRAITLSLVMAIFAVFMVQSYVGGIQEATQKKFGTEVLVVQAKRNIREGSDINETMLELKAIPKRFLEPGAISYSPQKGDSNNKVAKRGLRQLGGAGMVAIVPIRKGEQLTYNEIVEPGVRTGLASQVSPGRRAIAIPVSEMSAVGKLVKPGDRVDVIAVLGLGGGKLNRIAKTILQDVVVLAVGHNVAGNVAREIEPNPFGGKEKIRSLSTNTNFATVTLELEPAQAQALALVLANANNVLTLSLRNNDDTDRQNLASTSILDVLGPDAARLRGPAGR